MDKYKLTCLVLILFAALSLSAEWHPPKPVREIAVPTLSDIAIASFDAYGPVIYYNPTLVMRAGRGFAMFTRAHEYGHIYNGHIQRSMFVGNPYARVRLQQNLEVEADLFAVEQLYRAYPEAVNAAIVFFQRQGPIQLAPTHPSGTQRAAYIKQRFDQLRLGNRTNTGSNQYHVEEDDEEMEDLEPVSVTIEIPLIRRGELGGIITIYLDGERVGKISNFHDDYDTSIDIDVKPGVHEYKLRVKIYTFFGYQHRYYRTLTGRGQIDVEEYDTFVVSDGAMSPKLIKD